MTVASPPQRNTRSEPDGEREWPVVTVTIPTLNEARFIRQTLAAILAQDYPPERLEIIIADGMSTDGTREVITAFCRERERAHGSPGAPTIRVIDNPKRIVSTGLNAAVRAAGGEYIVRIDGHTIVEPDYIRQCVCALERSGAAGVGGRMRAVGVGYVAESIALATSSRFGIGNSTYRTRRFLAERAVETTHMGAYRRQTLLDIGLFNEEFVRHQDYELDYRIRQQGGAIWLSPAVRSRYFVRGTLRKLWRQYFQYGFWKGRMLRQQPASARVRHLVPPAFVFALVAATLLALLGQPLGLASFGLTLLAIVSMLYFAFIVTGSALIVAGGEGRRKYAPLLPLALACVHLSWGSGLWLGLLAPDRFSPRRWPR